MGSPNWRRPKIGQILSAYLDGELLEEERGRWSRWLVFDREGASQLSEFKQVAAQVDQAVEPAHMPDGSGVAERILAGDVPGTAEEGKAPFGVGKAALIASVGLAITAGLTLIHMRSRGRLTR